MAGIKGLKKGERPDIEKEAESFIRGATERVAQHTPPKHSRQNSGTGKTSSAGANPIRRFGAQRCGVKCLASQLGTRGNDPRPNTNMKPDSSTAI